MTALPRGFRIALDRSVRIDGDGRVLIGGAPMRVVHLTAAGRKALEGLQAGTDDSDATLQLGARLVDAGIAHPRPPRPDSPLDVTVVIPVRNRPAELERCLAAIGDAMPVVVVDDESRDARSVASICDRYRATLIRLETGKGAAAARNAGLAAIASEFVAFVDSDCVPSADWLEHLAGHFADPAVGAVAPRIHPVSPAGPASVLSRFGVQRSPLDLGGEEGPVKPGTRVSYVPTAALVVRREALEQPFDPSLRYGEDVDLVWRLHDDGWRVRYVPDVAVQHEEPGSWLGLLRRRFNYGTAAAPLAQRHPERLTHLVVTPLPLAAAALLLGRQPKLAAAAAAIHSAVLMRRSRGISPARAARLAAASVGHTVLGVGHAATVFATPVLLLGLVPRATRRGAVVLLVARPLEEWARQRPRLDPVRWTAACIADDVAYGLGVWRGCVEHGTLTPLRPTSTGPNPQPTRAA